MKHIDRIRAIAHRTHRLALAAARDASQPTGVAFPDASSAWLKNGTFVDVEQLRRIGRSMDKNQVRDRRTGPRKRSTPHPQ